MLWLLDTILMIIKRRDCRWKVLDWMIFLAIEHALLHLSTVLYAVFA